MREHDAGDGYAVDPIPALSLAWETAASDAPAQSPAIETPAPEAASEVTRESAFETASNPTSTPEMTAAMVESASAPEGADPASTVAAEDVGRSGAAVVRED